MSAAVRSDYRRPYFIPELGEEGLSHWDVAAALRVRPDVVLKKLRRVNLLAYKSHGWNITPHGVKSGQVGRPRIVWYLNTAAAKVFVSRWENERGDGYLSFLLACEHLVNEELPRFKAQVEQLIAENTRLAYENVELKAKLAGDNVKALPPKVSTVLIPVAYRHEYNLFGELATVPVYAQVEKKRLSRTERRTAKRQHLARLTAGMTREMKRLEEEEMLEKLPAGARPPGAGRG